MPPPHASPPPAPPTPPVSAQARPHGGLLLPADLVLIPGSWLSCNALLARETDGAGDLIDSGHARDAAATTAAVAAALGPGGRLRRLLSTHLHSDHCGGHAALQAAHPGVATAVPAAVAGAVAAWDRDALGYRPLGQHCPRFQAGGTLQPGTTMRLGRRDWQLLAAPGHDPDALLFFDPRDGLLMSGDALWEDGLGAIFPELDDRGTPGRAFAAAEATLDLIARLPVAAVVPGHGPVFGDVTGALARARSRLAAHRAEPDRHRRHGARVLIKFHLMEVGRLDATGLAAWAEAAPLMVRLAERLAPGVRAGAWARQLAEQMVASGVLQAHGDAADRVYTEG